MSRPSKRRAAQNALEKAALAILKSGHANQKLQAGWSLIKLHELQERQAEKEEQKAKAKPEDALTSDQKEDRMRVILGLEPRTEHQKWFRRRVEIRSALDQIPNLSEEQKTAYTQEACGPEPLKTQNDRAEFQAA
jgi:hypothetical protein